eukprot:TRINITY_DN23660_c0_g1_i1.p2 TRINITY_DN23660_c0_g1~~TRINITY_DN23660_c0_g1_i1.p2  ORF type:complete len:171 (+),score=0.09 TRINITY_DN23660_c0_g1_i1:155-667(+)
MKLATILLGLSAYPGGVFAGDNEGVSPGQRRIVFCKESPPNSVWRLLRVPRRVENIVRRLLRAPRRVENIQELTSAGSEATCITLPLYSEAKRILVFGTAGDERDLKCRWYWHPGCGVKDKSVLAKEKTNSAATYNPPEEDLVLLKTFKREKLTKSRGNNSFISFGCRFT